MKNNETQNSDGEKNTIIETETKSTPNICENITTKKLGRNCPTCNRIIMYSRVAEKTIANELPIP